MLLRLKSILPLSTRRLASLIRKSSKKSVLSPRIETMSGTKLAAKLPPKGLWRFEAECSRNAAFLTTCGLLGWIERLEAMNEKAPVDEMKCILELFDKTQIKTGPITPEKSSTNELAQVFGRYKDSFKHNGTQGDMLEWVELLFEKTGNETKTYAANDHGLFTSYTYDPDYVIVVGHLTFLGAMYAKDVFKKIDSKIIPNHIILSLPIAQLMVKQMVPHTLKEDIAFNLNGKDEGYDLVARTEHEGENVKSGHHYYLTKRGAAWFKVNDAEVKTLGKISFSPNVKQYVFVYQLVKIKKDGPTAIDEKFLEKWEPKTSDSGENGSGNDGGDGGDWGNGGSSGDEKSGEDDAGEEDQNGSNGEDDDNGDAKSEHDSVKSGKDDDSANDSDGKGKTSLEFAAFTEPSALEAGLGKMADGVVEILARVSGSYLDLHEVLRFMIESNCQDPAAFARLVFAYESKKP